MSSVVHMHIPNKAYKNRQYRYPLKCHPHHSHCITEPSTTRAVCNMGQQMSYGQAASLRWGPGWWSLIALLETKYLQLPSFLSLTLHPYSSSSSLNKMHTGSRTTFRTCIQAGWCASERMLLKACLFVLFVFPNDAQWWNSAAESRQSARSIRSIPPPQDHQWFAFQAFGWHFKFRFHWSFVFGLTRFR